MTQLQNHTTASIHNQTAITANEQHKPPVERFEPGFSLIPVELMQGRNFIEGFKHTGRLMLVFLQVSRGGTGDIFLSNKTIMDRTFIPDEQSVIRAKNRLKKKGLIFETGKIIGRGVKVLRIKTPHKSAPAPLTNRLTDPSQIGSHNRAFKQIQKKTTPNPPVAQIKEIPTREEAVVVFPSKVKVKKKTPASMMEITNSTTGITTGTNGITTGTNGITNSTTGTNGITNSTTGTNGINGITTGTNGINGITTSINGITNSTTAPPEPTLHQSITEKEQAIINRIIAKVSPNQAKELIEELQARLSGEGAPIRNPVGFVAALVKSVKDGTWTLSAAKRVQENEELKKRRIAERATAEKKQQAANNQQKADQTKLNQTKKRLTKKELQNHRVNYIKQLESQSTITCERMKATKFQGFGFNMLFDSYLKTVLAI